MLGLVVVPMLFVHLPTAAMAGTMAARLFTVQTWISLACASVLLVLNWRMLHARDFTGRRQPFSWFPLLVCVALLCAVVAEWWVAPKIMAREDLQRWHRLGSAMYLIQWLCALTVFQVLLKRHSEIRGRWLE
jgi:Domain of unknown function (DUF4149)